MFVQGHVVCMVGIIMRLLGLGSAAVRLANAASLDTQRKEWEAAWPVSGCALDCDPKLITNHPCWKLQSFKFS